LLDRRYTGPQLMCEVVSSHAF